jgi:hypothetical protein
MIAAVEVASGDAARLAHAFAIHLILPGDEQRPYRLLSCPLVVRAFVAGFDGWLPGGCKRSRSHGGPLARARMHMWVERDAHVHGDWHACMQLRRCGERGVAASF